MILNKTADMVYERAQNIAKSLETIKDNISQKASTADMLVQIETYLEKAKLEGQRRPRREAGLRRELDHRQRVGLVRSVDDQNDG